jgi:hypothetical protein
MQAAKGASSTEIILYSNFGTVIKSVKIIEGRMVQVRTRRDSLYEEQKSGVGVLA